MLLYLNVYRLYNASLVQDFYSWSKIPPVIKLLNSRSLWSSFECSAIRNSSEGPAISIEPFQKVQREVTYFPYVVIKNEKLPKILQNL